MKAAYRSTLAPLFSLRRINHSASLRATGSVMVLATSVASPGFCLRTSSITFSSAPASAAEVDAVAATAERFAGLCSVAAGGRCRIGSTAAAGLVTASFVDGRGSGTGRDCAAAFGALRATGLGFGSGTFEAASAASINPAQPRLSASIAVDAFSAAVRCGMRRDEDERCKALRPPCGSDSAILAASPTEVKARQKRLRRANSLHLQRFGGESTAKRSMLGESDRRRFPPCQTKAAPITAPPTKPVGLSLYGQGCRRPS
ncbi:hypothetical protein LOC51_21665 [Rubrivivax sp. JA1024]|nr:hypothetical protein [Rubrivivax sp. JA1024]